MKTKIITQDIYFVASLLSLGHKIENIDKSEPRHMKFTVAQGTPSYNFASVNLPDVGAAIVPQVGLEYFENLWDEGKLEVNAVAFKHAFQRVQSLIHTS